MKAPPKGHIINSIASTPMSWKDAVCELIDNAFDHGATSVRIEVGAKRVSIDDDGAGCPNLEAFVRLGETSSTRTRRLGRYGVGGKEAALIIGGTGSRLQVSSCHRGRVRELDIRWQHFAASEWSCEDPTERPAEAGERGTRIVISPVTKRPPSKDDWERLVTEIGYVYSPAIKQQSQITLSRSGQKPEPAPQWKMPRFNGDPVDTHIAVSGKTARVYAGVVAQGEANPRRGMTYLHEFRVIVPACQKGCGRYNASRVCGFVKLDGSWHLAKNKNAIVEDEAELEAAVEEAIRPILERADREGQTMASVAFERDVTDRMNEVLKENDRKAKRGSGSKEGGRKRTGKGGRHRKARRSQEGSTFSERVRPGELKICHDYLGSDAGVGKFDAPVVYLNRDHPLVDATYREQNTIAGLLVASSLISAEHVFAPNGQTSIRDVEVSADKAQMFSRSMGTILGTDITVDGKPALRAVK